MSTLNLADFARSNREPAPAATGATAAPKREEAKIWLNFGYIKNFKNEQGEDDQVFVTIARGIPVDQIEPFDLTGSRAPRNANMATLRRDQNKFLAAILGEAEKLEPGQSKIVAFDNDRNLGVELRRVGNAAVPHEEDDNAPLPFSFG